MPARKGPRPATQIVSVTQALLDYLFDQKGTVDEKYLYGKIREINELARNMAANTGKQDPRLRRKPVRAK